MRERPILFSDPMVRAIIEGRKTQTRRIVKPQGASMFPMMEAGGVPRGDWFISYPKYERVGNSGHFCPYGKPGDHLWVREAWAETNVLGMPAPMTVYLAYDTATDYGGPWKPSIHMHRWRSRIDLEITGVRAERLREISEADAEAEGVTVGAFSGGDNKDARRAYITLWESINGPGSWVANPWVWVIEFKRVTP